ncbi:unnamed protein product [Dibothriocephalus latus]|uniref:RING-type E3 ubiquitin transferase n=1 Tax=Dibothriocephalus latus TaxID=60516 RepID=A0A3P7PKX0_DIBLA|nr:unnamed protein product [Dibothriocephalus latus]
MFDASAAQRVRAFNYAPLVFAFIHWTMGLMYIFYVSSLFFFVRDVLRPGVLWFLQDFNDPDYKPVQEMISMPVHTYIQRLMVNVVSWLVHNDIRLSLFSSLLYNYT